MKPFDLEAAKRGEPLITREGKTIEFVGRSETKSGPKIICTIDSCFTSHYDNGAYFEGGREGRLDLFMAPKKRTVWVNIYKHMATWHETQEASNVPAHPIWGHRVGDKAWPLEIEE